MIFAFWRSVGPEITLPKKHVLWQSSPENSLLHDLVQRRIGVRWPALEWFHSYLEDRYQVVHIQGESSDPVQLIFGVPQGSVLGPFEFLVYMCPIYDIARKHGISIHQYADDTQLYLAFDLEHQDEAMAKIEACVNDIRRWMLETKLKLNDDKSELVVIAPARHAHAVQPVQAAHSQVLALHPRSYLGSYLGHTWHTKKPFCCRDVLPTATLY